MHKLIFGTAFFAVSLAIAVLSAEGAAETGKEKVIYNFSSGEDGANPWAGLIADARGNLYGTTINGGAGNSGTVFKVTPGGDEKVLYTFKGRRDGFSPYGGLLADAMGNLYGTTTGGDGFVTGYYGFGQFGTVFKLTPEGKKTVLHYFGGRVRSDGAFPYGGLIADATGNLYGTTYGGGDLPCIEGCGTVFKLTPEGQESVLHKFTAADGEGGHPYGHLVADAMGNLYGTTASGGTGSGYGTVFKLTPEGEETVLYSFKGGSDGAYPYAGLLADAIGNLYGTTSGGDANDYGTVFKLSPEGEETVLYSFTGGSDGAYPSFGAELIADAEGNLYGTTSHGGSSGYGTVFKLSPQGEETVLYFFMGGSDGTYPFGGLLADAMGNLYGTAEAGGSAGNNSGVVFKVKE